MPTTTNINFNWQGHRGARGLLPENTIPAFIKALDFPIQTLECDVVISENGLVIISHEPYFSAEICTKPDGMPVTEEEAEELRIFELSYEEIKEYDCGQRPHPRFPKQHQMRVYKPSLIETVREVQAFCQITKRPQPHWNIEIKSAPEGDDIFHPTPAVFVDILVKELKKLGIYNLTNLQSFDVRPLQILHKEYPDMPLAFLVENEDAPEENLAKLGFIPEIYSCYYKFLTKEIVEDLHQKGMKVIPWTVNTKVEMDALIEMGVDGIITDYPNLI
ncbi:MAG: glycerophosphoryl diester phosphodiesterase [Saprospiraceae bacterium]|jgi:glycerophosphoryl diester phosphodiesterase